MTPRPSIAVAPPGWLGPLGALPSLARHALALLLVLACFGARRALGAACPSPFLLLFPAILAAAFVLDLQPGLLAVAASALLSASFLIEPRGRFAPTPDGHASARRAGAPFKPKMRSQDIA